MKNTFGIFLLFALVTSGAMANSTTVSRSATSVVKKAKQLALAQSDFGCSGKVEVEPAKIKDREFYIVSCTTGTAYSSAVLIEKNGENFDLVPFVTINETEERSTFVAKIVFTNIKIENDQIIASRLIRQVDADSRTGTYSLDYHGLNLEKYVKFRFTEDGKEEEIQLYPTK